MITCVLSSEFVKPKYHFTGRSVVTFLLILVMHDFTFAQFQYVNPRPGSGMHNPEATIILRSGDFIKPESIENNSFLEIKGTVSGYHDWTARLSDDGKTVIIKPDPIFGYGENVSVTVNAKLNKYNGEKIEGTSFSFGIREKITPEQEERYRIARKQLNDEFLGVHAGSKDDIELDVDSMPTFKIIANNNPSSGRIFFTSRGQQLHTKYFPTIINNNGNVVFVKSLVNSGTDFKINDNGYLSYFQSAKWMILDSNFNIIDSIQCTNGYEEETNVHDFQYLSDNHALLIAYDIQTVDMTVYGGLPDATVYGLILQELDADGDLVFEWRSWDHFLFTDASPYTPLTNAIIDYCHGNSIERDLDGNILISCRNMDELTKIDRSTGDIIWRMGGENNQFTFVNDNIPEHFHAQHDLRRLPNGNITIYNNGNQLPVLMSSAKEYSLDEVNKVATLVWYYEHPDVNGNHVYGTATGNVQRLQNGNTLIDWGIVSTAFDLGLPNFTEVNQNKQIVWELKFDTVGQYSYRAFKFDWNPCSRITGYTMKAKGDAAQMVLSWGPATGAKKYKVQYRKVGTTVWSAKNTTKPKTQLTGLTPMSLYEWRVKTICSADGSVTSAYSELDTFKSKQPKFADAIAVSDQLSIYPLPAGDQITIKLNDIKPASLTIVDRLGTSMYKAEIVSDNGNAIEVAVGDWPSGLYIVEVKNDVTFLTKRIIVQ